MDDYTKKCSTLKELQEAWTPKRWDIVWYADNKWHITFKDPLTCTCQLRAHEQDDLFASKIDYSLLTYLPILEQLIAMLESVTKDWTLLCDEGRHYEVGITTLNFTCGNTPEEAMLKLVAWELYGKRWHEDKQEWREG